MLRFPRLNIFKKKVLLEQEVLQNMLPRVSLHGQRACFPINKSTYFSHYIVVILKGCFWQLFWITKTDFFSGTLLNTVYDRELYPFYLNETAVLNYLNNATSFDFLSSFYAFFCRHSRTFILIFTNFDIVTELWEISVRLPRTCILKIAVIRNHGTKQVEICFIFSRRFR